MTVLINIFLQCIEYKNDEQFRLLIPTIQIMISQKLSLYPIYWSKITIILSGPTTFLHNHCMNSPQFAALCRPLP
jgi:hypothetical protein